MKNIKENYFNVVVNNALKDLRKTRDFFLSQQNEFEADQVREVISNFRNVLNEIDIKKAERKRNRDIIFMYKNYIPISKIADHYKLSKESIYKIVNEIEFVHKNSLDYAKYLKSESKKLKKEYEKKQQIITNFIENGFNRKN